MHYHAEVWVPKVEWAVDLVGRLMELYSENNEDSRHSFWDWYVIGGRWSGEHTQWVLKKRYPEQYEKFWKEFEKNELGWVSKTKSEASQKARAVELFKKTFPKWKGPLIVGRDIYHKEGMSDDIMEATKIEWDLFSCATMILPIDSSDCQEDFKKEAETDPYHLGRRIGPRHNLYLSEIWNGSVFQKTAEDFKKIIVDRGFDKWGYWVTVDYHS